MNAIQNLQQTETRLVNAIAAATAAVDAVATGSLEEALAGLEAAVARARGRLDAALGFVQAVVGGLASDFDAATLALEADAADVSSKPPSVAQNESAVVEPVNGPLDEEATAEAKPAPAMANPTSSAAEGIDLSEAADVASVGTDGAQVEPGVNRVAEALGTAPSANGHGSKRSRRRK